METIGLALSNIATSLVDKLGTLSRQDLLHILASIVQSNANDSAMLQLIEREIETAGSSKGEVSVAKSGKQKNKAPKQFDMSKYSQRHVAIQLQYDGSEYFGFASQKEECCEETVEKYLFEALVKLRLIESRKSCNYSRCGRTDKGVSGMRQVVAFYLRSNMPNRIADGVKAGDRQMHDSFTEIDYCNLLNKALPSQIRAVGVSFVSPEFSARRNLDLALMNEAAQLLVGSHDFRNFCHLDAPNVTNFVREVLFARIAVHEEHKSDSTRSVFYLEISGIAFLWHMVRCIMEVLFTVGQRRENPSIITRLLDVLAEPAKPYYPLAADYPLLLYDCGFEKTEFSYSPIVLKGLEKHFEDICEKHIIAAARAKTSLEWIQGCPVSVKDVDDMLLYNYKQCQGKTKKQLPPPHSCRELTSALRSSASESGVVEGAEKVVDEMLEPASKRQKVEEGEAILREEAYPWGLVKGFVLNEQYDTARYVPLLERPRGDTFETRQARLSGSKKERFEKHLNHKQDEENDSLAESSKAFFDRKRQEGSLPSNATTTVL